MVNCGSWCHQRARCFSKDLTSISRRAQLPAPLYFKKSVLCAVLLLGSLAHLVFWVTRVMQPEPLRSNVSIAGCSDSSPRTSCLLKEAKTHSRIPWGSLTRCRDVRWLYGASYLKHLKTGFHTWVSATCWLLPLLETISFSLKVAVPRNSNVEIGCEKVFLSLQPVRWSGALEHLGTVTINTLHSECPVNWTSAMTEQSNPSAEGTDGYFSSNAACTPGTAPYFSSKQSRESCDYWFTES